MVHTDGSLPAEGVLSTRFAGAGPQGGYLAVSPDGKTVYASGVRHGIWSGKPAQVFYRFGWGDDQARPFLGTLKEAGKGPRHLDDPKGIAVDGQGNLYVADQGNNRVAVFKASGEFLGEIAVDRPAYVEVDPRKGTVYVLAGAKYTTLLKYASYKAAKPIATAELPYYKNRHFQATMALDAGADKPILWFGCKLRAYGLLRVSGCCLSAARSHRSLNIYAALLSPQKQKKPCSTDSSG